MSPVQPARSMGDEAYRAIIRMILAGTYRPGEIFRETELAELLGFSRTPVSVALSQLVAEGFLEKRKKMGCVIPIPTADDALKVFEARRVIEGRTAAGAALHASAEQVAELERALQIQDRSMADGSKEGFSDSNTAFHMGIARMSGNPYYERYCRHAFWRSNTYVFFFDNFYQHHRDSSPVSRTAEYHQKILAAIAGHHAEDARRAMEEHVQVTYEGLLLHLA